MVATTRQYRFSSLHQLLAESEDPKCCAVHGHEYHLQVSLLHNYKFTKDSELDSQFIRTHDDLDQTVHQRLLPALQGRALHQILPSTSGESLVVYLQTQIEKEFPDHQVRVFLRETRKNFFAGSPQTTLHDA